MMCLKPMNPKGLVCDAVMMCIVAMNLYVMVWCTKKRWIQKSCEQIMGVFHSPLISTVSSPWQLRMILQVMFHIYVSNQNNTCLKSVKSISRSCKKKNCFLKTRHNPEVLNYCPCKQSSVKNFGFVKIQIHADWARIQCSEWVLVRQIKPAIEELRSQLRIWSKWEILDTT